MRVLKSHRDACPFLCNLQVNTISFFHDLFLYFINFKIKCSGVLTYIDLYGIVQVFLFLFLLCFIIIFFLLVVFYFLINAILRFIGGILFSYEHHTTLLNKKACILCWSDILTNNSIYTVIDHSWWQDHF